MVLRGTGLNLDTGQRKKLELLMAADRRSLSFLVRDAIDLYLESRKSEICELQRRKNKQAKEKAAPVVPRIDSGTF
jgi:hypothetical protein